MTEKEQEEFKELLRKLCDNCKGRGVVIEDGCKMCPDCDGLGFIEN